MVTWPNGPMKVGEFSTDTSHTSHYYLPFSELNENTLSMLVIPTLLMLQTNELWY